MKTIQNDMHEYRKQLAKGSIQRAYRGLMDYMLGLRTYLSKKYPEYSVSGSLYFGYMDMTYFAFTPKSLADRKLKVAIVFMHETFRFETWLAGGNRKIQSAYWQLFAKGDWKKYHLVELGKGVDAIVDHILVENPDFSNPDQLTGQIEAGTLKFIEDVSDFLSRH
jgi:hypothetical protein